MVYLHDYWINLSHCQQLKHWSCDQTDVALSWQEESRSAKWAQTDTLANSEKEVLPVVLAVRFLVNSIGLSVCLSLCPSPWWWVPPHSCKPVLVPLSLVFFLPLCVQCLNPICTLSLIWNLSVVNVILKFFDFNLANPPFHVLITYDMGCTSCLITTVNLDFIDSDLISFCLDSSWTLSFTCPNTGTTALTQHSTAIMPVLLHIRKVRIKNYYRKTSVPGRKYI